jgi:hypothetical protein
MVQNYNLNPIDKLLIFVAYNFSFLEIRHDAIVASI